MTHKSLFFNKAIDYLITNKDGLYIDCTLGLGGHSKQILNRLSINGLLIALDNDLNTKTLVKNLEFYLDKRFSFININFKYLEIIAKKKHLFGIVSGILLDLGISTYQIKDYKRGFSFFINGPLDMRINNTFGITACCLLNHYKFKQIFKIFKTYGEDEQLYRLTVEICNRRHHFPFKMTLELSNLIKTLKFTNYHIKHQLIKTKPKIQKTYIIHHKSIKIKQKFIKHSKSINTKHIIIKENTTKNKIIKTNNNNNSINKKKKKHIHPSTKIFQAIRSYINNEIQNLEIVIITSLKLLKTNKKLIIITFNSLESQIVNKVLKTTLNKVNKIYPSIEEVFYNNSSRCSAIFIIQKL
ncbi:16S rRNA (cytosine(1402)-N(4))-methyltransferase [Candidatus Portiera aleyrodidarum]|uniref:16S rRNA (cytosine(1402)-N(4))-methyltransferase n=1 Tax=Candidatus Portiera aleyrodidarum TaxID=91844 RepID=UPI00027E67F8|nr:16S rRNA (cytosine(1402)-N(4))-methyltransferase [Candidatus Portiera aleyrodidarum]AFS18965.1 Ribosomal RNA small subunit methyltransferase H [Candidatus Portiera aleyrodidarum BT-QVLC]